MYMLINLSATQQFRSFFISVSSLLGNELKLAQTAQIDQLFKLLNLACVYSDVLCWSTRVLISKM